MRKILDRLKNMSIHWGVRSIRSLIGEVYYQRSYAGEGEDIILLQLLGQDSRGFYVDIGAHHPLRFSNTYIFYRLGWSGINIDAAPGSMKEFRKHRPNDINIEAAIASEPCEMIFYMFDDPALNTFDLALARRYISYNRKIVREVRLKTYRIDTILEQHIPKYQKIDFMSIDVEGLDLEVLQSNDWERFRPRYIVVECLDLDIAHIQSDQVYTYLYSQEYRCIAKTLKSSIYENIRKEG